MWRVVFVLGLLVGPCWADEAKLLKTAQALYDGVRQETLPNGLRVFLKPVPGAPTVTTMVGYKVGAADEELDQTGLSHYLEHLMFKGTDKLLPGDIDRLTQRNGGMNNAYTSEDMTVYHFDFAADRWLTALAIEADRMRNLRIDTKHEFEQEKGAVISELDGNEDEPWELELKLILPLLFGEKTPYGHPVIGQKQHVRDATAAIIKKHYDTWYHPNNAVLVVVGGFDEKEALTQITKLFGSLPSTKLPDRKPVPEHQPRKEVVRKKFENKFETPRLLMGFNTVPETHADSVALDVVSYLLTGGKSARLYKKLIYGEGSCTSVSASHSSGRYPGWFALQAELLKDELPKIEATLMAELKALATDGPTEAELKRVRRSVLASHIFEDESIHEQANTITRGVIANDMAFVQRYLPDILKVSAADIKRVVRQYLLDQAPVVIESRPMKVSHAERPVALRTPKRPLYRDVPLKAGTNFALKDARKEVLPNGLKVILLENHRLPIVVADVRVANVRLYEPKAKLGTAALMGNLLEEGTTKRTGPEIAQLIEDTGGSLSVNASGGSVQVLTDDTALGLDVLFDCLLRPKFGADELDAQREQLLAELAEDDKSAQTRASRALMTAIYGDHPYGHPPALAEVVKKLTPADLHAFHRQVVVPNNTVLVVVGDFETEAMLKSITQLTAEWKRQELPKVELPKPPVVKEFTQTIISDPNAAQLQMYLGHLGIKRNNPDFYKLLVMDNVLGTGPGFTDRLSASLRDRQGLAYTVQATIADSASDEEGIFSGYIGTFPDKFHEVKEGFLKEFNRIRTEVPTKDEVEDAKKYLTGSLAFKMTTCASAAKMLQAVERYGFGPNYLDDYRKAVNAVTPEDVQAVAQKYLDPKRLILSAAGAIDSAGKPLKKD